MTGPAAKLSTMMLLLGSSSGVGGFDSWLKASAAAASRLPPRVFEATLTAE